MHRKISVGNTNQKRKRKNLTKKEARDAIIGKAFCAIVGSIVIFSLFNGFLADTSSPFPVWLINTVGIVVCIGFVVFIFTRDSKHFAQKTPYRPKRSHHADSSYLNDCANPINQKTPSSPFYRDPFKG